MIANYLVGRSWIQHTLVVLLAAGVGLSYSLSYGMETQATYLLNPLRALDPSFLEFDWLAAQTTAYHKDFAIVVKLLSLFGSLPWGIAIANVALGATFVLAIYWFLSAHFKRDTLVVILILMLFVVIERTASIADSHILTFRFEPSSVAACAAAIGLLLLVAERYLWSGVAIAVGGFFHTNFLLLDFVFFGCAHLALGRAGLIRRGFLQFAPSLVVLLHDVPMLYAMATDPLAENARYIMQFIRAPHHFRPVADLWGFVAFAGWHLLAIAGTGIRTENTNTSSRLLRVYLAFTGVIIIAAILTTIVFVPQVAQLLFLRMSPFSILLAQLIIATSIAAGLATADARQTARRDGWRVLAAACGGGLIVAYYVSTGGILDTVFVAVSMVVLVAMIAVACGYWRFDTDGARYRPSCIRLEAVFLGLLIPALVWSAAPPRFTGALAFSETSPFYKRYNVFLGEPAPFRGLYEWAQSTHRASQFLIPPNMKSFRVFAGRAVVVDWQSTPWLPSEVIEWYRRIGRVSGNPDVRAIEDAETGYARMDQARLRALAEEFGVDYAVFRKPFDVQQVNAEVVYENKDFLVVKACGGVAGDCGRQHAPRPARD
jgi:hypothetical protein